jgi:hypothetical protein
VSGDDIELDAGRAPRDPEQVEAAGAGSPPKLPSSTTLGPVHVTVSDLGRSLDYYGQAIGLHVLEREDGRVSPVVQSCGLVALGLDQVGYGCGRAE